MNLSLGEYRALVAKAFRGAGYHWGLTEEAAHAACQLVELGIDSPALITRLLEQVERSEPVDLMPDHQWSSSGGGPLCPICVGTSIADGGRADGIDIGPTFEPIVIAPFIRALIRAAEPCTYRIDWVGGGCDVTLDGLAPFGESPDRPVRIAVRRLEGVVQPLEGSADSAVQVPRSPERTRTARVELDPTALATLEAFAHRVYAPATEASRRAGAGGDL